MVQRLWNNVWTDPHQVAWLWRHAADGVTSLNGFPVIKTRRNLQLGSYIPGNKLINNIGIYIYISPLWYSGKSQSKQRVPLRSQGTAQSFFNTGFVNPAFFSCTSKILHSSLTEHTVNGKHAWRNRTKFKRLQHSAVDWLVNRTNKNTSFPGFRSRMETRSIPTRIQGLRPTWLKKSRDMTNTRSLLYTDCSVSIRHNPRDPQKSLLSHRKVPDTATGTLANNNNHYKVTELLHGPNVPFQHPLVPSMWITECSPTIKKKEMARKMITARRNWKQSTCPQRYISDNNK